MKKFLQLILILAASAAFAGEPLNPSFLNSYLTGNGWNWDTIICRDDQNIINERMTQVFDQNNFVVTQLYEKPYGTGWQNYIRNICNRDITGKLLNMVTEVWSGTDWAKASRITVTYNGLNQITEELVENYNNVWQNTKRRSYEYNGSGLKTQMLQEVWQNGIWKNDLMSVFTYDGNGNLHIVVASYTESGGPWIPGGKYTYTCEPNGNYIESLVESWILGGWVVQGKIDYTCSSQGDILSETYNIFQNNSWIPNSRKVYTYDSYGNALTGITEAYFGESWIPDMATSYLYYKKEYIQVINIPVYSYAASYRSVLATENHDKKKFLIYPNPASGYLVIDCTGETSPYSFRIITPNGVILRSNSDLKGTATIDISDIPDGVYFLETASAEKKDVEKIIIRKN